MYTYITREDLTIGQTVTIYGNRLTVVDTLGFDDAGRYGIRWSNGATEFAPADRRLALADTVYTMHNVDDANVRRGDGTQAFDLAQLREYAEWIEGQDRRVIIVGEGGNVVYLSPARRTEDWGNSPAQWATMEQIRVIRELLIQRDLIAETRPAWRRRMQEIRSDMSILSDLTFEQASTLWDALLALPVDESIDHIAFVNALHGYPETAYEDRCAETIRAAYADGTHIGGQRHAVLMGAFAY